MDQFLVSLRRTGYLANQTGNGLKHKASNWDLKSARKSFHRECSKLRFAEGKPATAQQNGSGSKKAGSQEQAMEGQIIITVTWHQPGTKVFEK